MPSASASGADAQGSKYTPEQKAAVIRIRKCSPTAFYEILSLQKSASDSEIKKAYRKQSLLTHPDKNGCDGADEAFKSESVDIDKPRSAVLTCASHHSGVQGFPGFVGRGQEIQVR